MLWLQRPCPLRVISGHVGLREQESALPLKADMPCGGEKSPQSNIQCPLHYLKIERIKGSFQMSTGFHWSLLIPFATSRMRFRVSVRFRCESLLFRPLAAASSPKASPHIPPLVPLPALGTVRPDVPAGARAEPALPSGGSAALGSYVADPGFPGKAPKFWPVPTPPIGLV